MQKMDMPHFSTHNPLKKELNLENIYQKLPIGIELYDGEGNLIDLNGTAIRHKTHGYYRHKPIRKSQFSGRPDSPLEKG